MPAETHNNTFAFDVKRQERGARLDAIVGATQSADRQVINGVLRKLTSL
jgi:hypothetical protein